MTLQEVMSLIESQHFAAEVNMAASSNMFDRGLRNHHLFRDLAEHMKKGREREEVFRRVLDLSRRPIQSEFENPFDAALAAYLIALDTEDPGMAAIAAETVWKAPNCWWAAEHSARLLAEAKERALLAATEQ
jgi:hypothetical protein